ncbi:MAG: cardiolipin synthase, partial [Anaerobacillus sp.]
MYLVFGQNLSRRRLFDWENIKKVGIEDLIEEQVSEIKDGIYPFRHEEIAKHKDLIYMHLVNDDAVLTQDNSIKVFTDGEKKFDALLKDIESAKDHIHFQYYIFQKDNLGKRIVEKLASKAREGVKVRLLYDEMGSRKTRKKFFKELIAAGGEVEVFFPSRIPYVNTRLNYRNHRKLVIIDGLTGYVGGFNVGDEYLGLNAKFGYWRDTHLRIEGSATLAMQTRFLLDWNHAARNKVGYEACYFPIVSSPGKAGVQVVSSGPDSEWEQIKNGYIKLITSAKRTIFIQTPYFIPDASLLDALRIAALSGVDVRLMIPNKPDHPFVYWATYSYVGELLKAGVTMYIYQNGFIHAKTIAVDGEISSVGTANIDVRSFRLNFEVNAFIYDEEITRQLEQIFIEDMEKSNELTVGNYLERSMWIRFKESISRLLSPIL